MKQVGLGGRGRRCVELVHVAVEFGLGELAAEPDVDGPPLRLLRVSAGSTTHSDATATRSRCGAWTRSRDCDA